MKDEQKGHLAERCLFFFARDDCDISRVQVQHQTQFCHLLVKSCSRMPREFRRKSDTLIVRRKLIPDTKRSE
jgi:hypothetical protein